MYLCIPTTYVKFRASMRTPLKQKKKKNDDKFSTKNTQRCSSCFRTIGKLYELLETRTNRFDGKKLKYDICRQRKRAHDRLRTLVPVVKRKQYPDNVL